VWEKVGIMKKINAYMANDGKVFTSLIECLKHNGIDPQTDKNNWDAESGITIFVEDMVIDTMTDKLLYALIEYAQEMVVKVENAESYNALMDVLTDVGKTTKGLSDEEGIIFYYNDKLKEWICLDKAQSKIKTIIEKMK
jgi:hypothetical protein